MSELGFEPTNLALEATQYVNYHRSTGMRDAYEGGFECYTKEPGLYLAGESSEVENFTKINTMEARTEGWSRQILFA